MFNLRKGEVEIQKALEDYLRQVAASLAELKDVFPSCLDGTQATHVDLDNPVHKEESLADDMLQSLKRQLHSGKLLPESRVELLNLVEGIDRVPNSAEAIVDFFTLQKLSVPDELHEQITALLFKSLEACAALSETVRLLMDDISRIPGLAQEVDRIESETDHIERVLLQRIFRLDIELAHKLHLRDLVRQIAGLADLAEDASDQAQSMALKRKP